MRSRSRAVGSWIVCVGFLCLLVPAAKALRYAVAIEVHTDGTAGVWSEEKAGGSGTTIQGEIPNDCGHSFRLLRRTVDRAAFTISGRIRFRKHVDYGGAGLAVLDPTSTSERHPHLRLELSERQDQLGMGGWLERKGEYYPAPSTKSSGKDIRVGEWYSLKLEVAGTKVRGFLDGGEVISGEIPALSSLPDKLQVAVFVIEADAEFEIDGAAEEPISAGVSPVSSPGRTLTLPQGMPVPEKGFELAYQGLPGNAQDWITVVKAGTADNVFGQWAYTGGKREGTMAFNGLAEGEYEARVYFDWPTGSYTVQDRLAIKISSGSKMASGGGGEIVGAAGWKWHDPKKDARYSQTSSGIAISAPNGNDLWPLFNYDAPRITSPASGDFTLVARVKADPIVEYHGAGLVVSAGSSSFVRFERGPGGKMGMSASTEGRLEPGRGEAPWQEKDFYLKLVRRGDNFSGYAKPASGGSWQKLLEIIVAFPAKVEAGVALINQHNDGVFTAEFSELALSSEAGASTPATVSGSPASVKDLFPGGREVHSGSPNVKWSLDEAAGSILGSIPNDEGWSFYELPVSVKRAEKPTISGRVRFRQSVDYNGIGFALVDPKSEHGKLTIIRCELSARQDHLVVAGWKDGSEIASGKGNSTGKDIKPGEWYDLSLKVNGTMVTGLLNGVEVVASEFPKLAEFSDELRIAAFVIEADAEFQFTNLPGGSGVTAPSPASPAGTSASEIPPGTVVVVEDDIASRTWNDGTPEKRTDFVASGSTAFRATGNNHFYADLAAVGDGAGDVRFIEFDLYLLDSDADFLLQLQAQSSWWDNRWGFDAEAGYNGYDWGRRGITTGMTPGRWHRIRLDLVSDLKIKVGDKLTGIAFSSNDGDALFDRVLLLSRAVGTASAGAANTTAGDFSGTWRTHDDEDLMITVAGGKATGSYKGPSWHGVVTGRVEGNVFEGIWENLSPNTRKGRFKLTLSDDGRTFSGPWELIRGEGKTAGTWSATRTGIVSVDTSSGDGVGATWRFLGQWNTTFGPLTFVRLENRMHGVYPLYLGTISGTVTGNVLEGEYQDQGGKGTIRFELSADGKKFAGRWKRASGTGIPGGDWTGNKLVIALRPDTAAKPAETPKKPEASAPVPAKPAETKAEPPSTPETKSEPATPPAPAKTESKLEAKPAAPAVGAKCASQSDETSCVFDPMDCPCRGKGTCGMKVCAP